MVSSHPSPDALLVLADGTAFRGRGIGAPGTTGGELCFNTSMTGYQEIMTDPSYAGQIITFTFPHIGNTGANTEDNEADRPFAKGLILRTDITAPSNHRSERHFNGWLKESGITGICGVDTRALTHHLRDHGAQNGIIHFPCHSDPAFIAGEESQALSTNIPRSFADAQDDMLLKALAAQAKALPDMNGLDIAKTVSTKKIYSFCPLSPRERVGERDCTTLDAPLNPSPSPLRGPPPSPAGRERVNQHHVVAVDYGIKRNILHCLAAQGFRVTVVPCDTTAENILALNPDGIFLSNGPGDPAATGVYAVPVIQKLLKSGLPLFGICLGHQLLALALGGKTAKLPFGHRGANHPVKNLETGKIEITSQNHGFHVTPDTLPDTAQVTHISLFDGTNEGLSLKGRPVFSVQYHPEASPGPHDSHYLFEQFKHHIDQSLRKTA